MISHDVASGRLSDGAIRYVLMRPDVLMGIARQLSRDSALEFLEALEMSAMSHAQSSFVYYKERGAVTLDALLSKSAEAANHLGWGVWNLNRGAEQSVQIVVRNSPFAEGFGASAIPVCAAIKGVLRAMFSAHDESPVTVTETRCAAQGAADCRFHVERAISK